MSGPYSVAVIAATVFFATNFNSMCILESAGGMQRRIHVPAFDGCLHVNYWDAACMKGPLSVPCQQMCASTSSEVRRGVGDVLALPMPAMPALMLLH